MAKIKCSFCRNALVDEPDKKRHFFSCCDGCKFRIWGIGPCANPKCGSVERLRYRNNDGDFICDSCAGKAPAEEEDVEEDTQ